MTTGIAKRSAVSADWLLRCIRAVSPDASLDEDGDVRIPASFGHAWARVDHDRTHLHFAATVDKHPEPSEAELREWLARATDLTTAADVSRFVWYPSSGLLRAEYDWPIVAGVSRHQVLTMLQAFLTDVAVAKRDSSNAADEP